MKRTKKKVAHKNPAKKKEKPTEEEPVEKKVGFWARLFGRKKRPAEAMEKPAEEKEAR